MRGAEARIETRPDPFGSPDNFMQDLFAEIPGVPMMTAGPLYIQPEIVTQRRSVRSTVEIIRLNKGIKFDPKSNLIDASDHFKAKQTLQDQAIVFQRMQAAAQNFDPDMCGGVRERMNIVSIEGGNNITNFSSFKANKSLDGKTQNKHESGAHGHCEHNEDYGKCSKGCKKAA